MKFSILLVRSIMEEVWAEVPSDVIAFGIVSLIVGAIFISMMVVFLFFKITNQIKKNRKTILEIRKIKLQIKKLKGGQK